MNTHTTAYTFGDIIYLKTDPEQHKRMILSIQLIPNGQTYEVGFGADSSFHLDIEMSAVPDESLRLGIEINK